MLTGTTLILIKYIANMFNPPFAESPIPTYWTLDRGVTFPAEQLAGPASQCEDCSLKTSL